MNFSFNQLFSDFVIVSLIIIVIFRIFLAISSLSQFEAWSLTYLAELVIIWVLGILKII
jgi:hypothetical protein